MIFHLNTCIHTVPFALQSKIELELNNLGKQDIITKINFFDWANPIVPVVKADFTYRRICGDFQIIINLIL